MVVIHSSPRLKLLPKTTPIEDNLSIKLHQIFAHITSTFILALLVVAAYWNETKKLYFDKGMEGILLNWLDNIRSGISLVIHYYKKLPLSMSMPISISIPIPIPTQKKSVLDEGELESDISRDEILGMNPAKYIHHWG